jgi:DNA-binding NarL/FixJ family response regulator
MKPLLMVNLKVVVMDTDYYTLQTLNGYLAWDRRTRVTHLSESPDELWRYLQRVPLIEQPDVIVLDSDHLGGSAALRTWIERFRARIPRVMVVCLAQSPTDALIETALTAGARAFLLKGEVRMQIAWAIVYAAARDFIVTESVMRAGEAAFARHEVRAQVLPPQRTFPELTGRVRQAIELCVIKGMPAQLAADEMGISLHTIRSYIKDGYRVLEAHDDVEYPTNMSPQERAFMRLTSFAEGSV